MIGGGVGPSETTEAEARLALLYLRKLGPIRARWLVGDGSAVEAVAMLRRGLVRCDAGPAPCGVTPELLRVWRSELATLDVAGLLDRHREAAVGILTPAHPQWPFHEDIDPPIALFYRGDLDLLSAGPRVGIVGTRRCTTVGRSAAHRFGADFARLGVGVVSGLALGIDGSAHRGVRTEGGAPIGVVATGLDVVYPAANRRIWQEVADSGLLLSEAPVGTRPERWRFPARNRLIAGLSDAVVIVESHARGGSLLTADEAIERNRPVFAVPGSILSPASDGSNRLLSDGAMLATSAADVVAALGLSPDVDPSADRAPSGTGHPATVGDLEQRILLEIGTGPVHVDALVGQTGATVAQVLVAVRQLVAAGHIVVTGSTVALPAADR